MKEDGCATSRTKDEMEKLALVLFCCCSILAVSESESPLVYRFKYQSLLEAPLQTYPETIFPSCLGIL